MKNQKVSVIIPAYNSRTTIEKCLTSILDQNYPNIEVIVIDDNSHDDTLRKVRKFSVKTISNTKTMGVAYSRNTGAKIASSDILVFVDSDVVVPPDGIYRIMKTLTEQTNTLIVFGNYSENSQNLSFISDYKNMDLVYRSNLAPSYLDFAVAFFLAIRKKTFEESGGFSETFSGSSVEDMEFGYRVCKGEYVAFQDRNIKVDHLKNYTVISLLKTNFKRVVNMMRIIEESRGKYKPGEYIGKAYFINLFLPVMIIGSFLMWVININYLWLSIILILLFFINNIGFIRFLILKRSCGFAVMSSIMLFIEYIGVEIAILFSPVFILYGKLKNK